MGFKENSGNFNVFDFKNHEPKPKDFMGARGIHYYSDRLYKSSSYAEAAEKIKTQPVIFLLGNPLSGKTRVVYDVFTELKKEKVYVPTKISSLEKYSPLPNDDNLILFIDELDVLLRNNSSQINLLVTNAISKNIQVVLCCRTGPEYEFVRNNIGEHILELLHQSQVIIKKIEKHSPEFQIFIKLFEYTDDQVINCDGNIGSLILPLTAMRNRYLNLEKNPDRELELSILRGLKLHYHLFNFEDNKSTYSNFKIKAYCTKELDYEPTESEWHNAKEVLTSTPEALNFLEDSENILIEEAYLDFLNTYGSKLIDVIAPSFNKNSIKATFKNLYTDLSEARELGFSLSAFEFNELIKKSQNFKEALKVYYDFPNPPGPSIFTTQFLEKKCISQAEFEELYRIISSQGKNTLELSFSYYASFFNEFESLIRSTIRLDKRRLFCRDYLNKGNGFRKKILSLGSKDCSKTKELLLELFTLEEIHDNLTFSHLIRYVTDSPDDFETFYKPFLPKFNFLSKLQKIEFIKGCSKLKQFDLSLSLIKANISDTDFDFFNEKGVCLEISDSIQSYDLFKKANELAKSNVEKLVSLNNLVRVVLGIQDLNKKNFCLNLAVKFLINPDRTEFHRAFDELGINTVRIKFQLSSLSNTTTLIQSMVNQKYFKGSWITEVCTEYGTEMIDILNTIRKTAAN